MLWKLVFRNVKVGFFFSFNFEFSIQLQFLNGFQQNPTQANKFTIYYSIVDSIHSKKIHLKCMRKMQTMYDEWNEFGSSINQSYIQRKWMRICPHRLWIEKSNKKNEQIKIHIPCSLGSSTMCVHIHFCIHWHCSVLDVIFQLFP